MHFRSRGCDVGGALIVMGDALFLTATDDAVHGECDALGARDASHLADVLQVARAQTAVRSRGCDVEVVMSRL